MNTHLDMHNQSFSLQSLISNVQAEPIPSTCLFIRCLQHHSKIRVSQLQTHRAQKRKQLQSQQLLQKLLNVQFPKQHQQAKMWTSNIVKIYTSSSVNFIVDAHKLREIFLLLQKFPNLFTLRLLYLALQNSSSESTVLLFDFDVMKVLHNVLKFPEMKGNQHGDLNGKANQLIQMNLLIYEQNTNNKQNLKLEQIQFIKLSIETIIQIYSKGEKFRNFSIQSHKTFSAYLLPAYKKYKEQIKTEVILFLRSSFLFRIKYYNKQYEKMLDLLNFMLIEYKQNFKKFIKRYQEQSNDFQTMHEAILRCGYAVGVITDVLNKQRQKWIVEYLNGKLMMLEQGYLKIIEVFMRFGLWVVETINDQHINTLNHQNNNGNIHNIFEDTHNQANQHTLKQSLTSLNHTIQLLYNCILFFSVYNETMSVDPINSHEYTLNIPKIFKHISFFLHLLKKSEEEQFFSNLDYETYVLVKKAKQLCMFVLGNGIGSGYGTYEEFIKKFLFFSRNNDNQVKMHIDQKYLNHSSNEPEFINLNLLQTIDLIIRTENSDQIIYQANQLIFTLLQLQTPSTDKLFYNSIKRIIESLCELVLDCLRRDQIKQSILRGFVQYIKSRKGSQHVHQLCIELLRQNYKQKFIIYANSEYCSKQLQTLLIYVIFLLDNDMLENI